MAVRTAALQQTASGTDLFTVYSFSTRMPTPAHGKLLPSPHLYSYLCIAAHFFYFPSLSTRAASQVLSLCRACDNRSAT